jgi:5-methylcytosine-specific restriction protein A
MNIRKFYNSYKWQKQRKYKLELENYRCNRCGGLAVDVHHKITLTNKNVNDFNISMNLDNLECLCRDCHNKETHGNKVNYSFNADGDLVEISNKKIK